MKGTHTSNWPVQGWTKTSCFIQLRHKESHDIFGFGHCEARTPFCMATLIDPGTDVPAMWMAEIRIDLERVKPYKQLDIPYQLSIGGFRPSTVLPKYPALGLCILFWLSFGEKKREMLLAPSDLLECTGQNNSHRCPLASTGETPKRNKNIFLRQWKSMGQKTPFWIQCGCVAPATCRKAMFVRLI